MQIYHEREMVTTLGPVCLQHCQEELWFAEALNFFQWFIHSARDAKTTLVVFNLQRNWHFFQHLKLREIVDNKNYTEFFEDEKELLWKLRGEVRQRYPESLSKLLLITKWNKHEDVAQVRWTTGSLGYDYFQAVKNRNI